MSESIGTPLITMSFTIERDGDHFHVRNSTHIPDGVSWQDAYRGVLEIKADIDRQIAERFSCPFHPKHTKASGPPKIRGCGMTNHNDGGIPTCPWCCASGVAQQAYGKWKIEFAHSESCPRNRSFKTKEEAVEAHTSYERGPTAYQIVEERCQKRQTLVNDLIEAQCKEAHPLQWRAITDRIADEYLPSDDFEYKVFEVFGYSKPPRIAITGYRKFLG